MTCRISFRYVSFSDGLETTTVTVITDVASHVTLRLSSEPPRKHLKSVVRRGEPFFSELRFCFTQYSDYEQEEAGDTLTHTFIVPWAPCETKWFYLFGSISSETCVSTSPPFRHHNVYVYVPPPQEILIPLTPCVGQFTAYDDRGDWRFRVCIGFTFAGYRSGEMRYGGGAFHFPGVPLSSTSTVLEAYLHFRPYSTIINTACNTKIKMEKSINASTFSSWANYLARTQFPEEVLFDNIEPWDTANWYYSPDFSSLLTLVINQPGWVPGNSVAVTWDDWENRSDLYAYRWCWGGSASPNINDTKLYIKYIP